MITSEFQKFLTSLEIHVLSYYNIWHIPLEFQLLRPYPPGIFKLLNRVPIHIIRKNYLTLYPENENIDIPVLKF